MSDTPQQVINLGSAPNSGNGEPLREAFGNVNNNFANVWAAGPVDSNVRIANNYVTTTSSTTDLVLVGNSLGNVQLQSTALTQHVRPLSDGVYDIGTANNWYDTGWIRYLNTWALSVVGNVSGNYFVGNVQGNTNGFAIGYRDRPQVLFSDNATTALGDAGKHYYSTSASNLTLTIANNASAAFAVGSVIDLINQGTGTITVAQGSGVTLYFAGNSTSGNRSVDSYGVATIQKVATDTWFIVGVGVT